MSSIAMAGFIGGGQVGYNYQLMKSFVIGAEADIQGMAGKRWRSQLHRRLPPRPARPTPPSAKHRAICNISAPCVAASAISSCQRSLLMAQPVLLYGGVSSNVWLATGGLRRHVRRNRAVQQRSPIPTPRPAGQLAAAWNGCFRQTGRQRLNISTTASQTATPAASVADTQRQAHGLMASALRAATTATSCAPA